MKKFLLFLLLTNFVFIRYAYSLEKSYDVEGLQPLAPYGIFSTFSTDSLKKGKAGIALGAGMAVDSDYYRFTGQFGYGITERLEVNVTVPYVLDWQGYADGFEDMAFGLKYRFLEEGKYVPSLALLVSGSLHTGRSEFSTAGSIGGGIILSKRIGPVTTHANLLYFRPGSGPLTEEITFAAGLDFAAAHNFKILTELYGQKSFSGSWNRLELRLGYRFLTAENFYTTVGAGTDLKNRNPEYRLFLSFSYLFPKERRDIKKIYEQEE
jgi:hypothetical protein